MASDFASPSCSLPNPIAQNCTLMQVLDNGVKRLAFKVPMPVPQSPVGLPSNVLTACPLECHHAGDLEAIGILANLAKANIAEQGSDEPRVQREGKGRGRSRAAAAGTFSSSAPAASGVSRGCEGAIDGAAMDSDTEGVQEARVEEEEWPRHKDTKKVKAAASRAFAVIMEFSTNSWASAASEASLRANIRTSLELDYSLEKCEHPMLIQKAKASTEQWKTVQAAMKAIKDYKKNETNEVLLTLLGPLDKISVFLKSSGKQLYASLEKLRLHARFVQDLTETGLEAAVDGLSLMATPCHAQSVYTTLASEVPTTMPKKFSVWVEADLMEVALKDKIRNLSMNPAAVTMELTDLHSFLDAYIHCVQKHSD
eukprot:2526780-Pyramimonas_sp.AAC.1